MDSSIDAGSAAASSASARALMAGVVDYAGLFPPAELVMGDAVSEYTRGQQGPDAWLLGRFVLPAARLDDLGAAIATVPVATAPWRLSVIVREGVDADRAAIAAHQASSAAARARVDSIEARPQAVAGVDTLADAFGADFDVYIEVPAGDDAPAWLSRVRDRGLRAKVRTGGVTADAFPASTALLTFLEAAVRLGVPFKATAGLHHAVRGAYRLTYELGSGEAAMYGYLNVLLATAALQSGFPREIAEDLLVRRDAAALSFTDEAVRWADVVLPLAALQRTRALGLVSFGSCSFREPVQELFTLHS